MLHDQPDCLFRQTPAQLRRIGARGGRACARNRRARVRAATAPPPKAVTPIARLPETAAPKPSLPSISSFLGCAGQSTASVPATSTARSPKPKDFSSCSFSALGLEAGPATSTY
jgi:hypothetical protein